MMKKKYIWWSLILLVCIGIGSYFLYQQHRQEIWDSIRISFTDTVQLEYGASITSDDLIQQTSGEIIAKTEPDTKKLGKQTLSFTLAKEGMERTFTLEIEVKDTQKPAIALKETQVSLAYGADFDPKSYVKSVKDPVDGDLPYQKENSKKAGYTIKHDVNTKKAGKYTVTYIAVDNHGNTTEKKLPVTVEPKKVVTEQKTATTRPAKKQVERDKNNRVIVINAGHQRTGDSSLEPIGPGASTQKAKVTYGASGIVSGKAESQINLEIAKKLQAELQARGYTVIMTRTSQDVNLSNRERALIGNKQQAAAVISLHCDSAGSSSAKGAHTIAPAADNPYCPQIVSASSRLASAVIQHYAAVTGISSRGVSYRNDLSGLNWSEVPAIYVEMGFLSNPDEDRKLTDPNFQYLCAQGIADGIDAYFA